MISILLSTLYINSERMKSLPSSEMFFQRSSNSHFPSLIFISVSLSLLPLNGEIPDNRIYVIMPTDHISALKETPSLLVTSGATYSGIPYNKVIIFACEILLARPKSQILRSSPPVCEINRSPSYEEELNEWRNRFRFRRIVTRGKFITIEITVKPR